MVSFDPQGRARGRRATGGWWAASVLWAAFAALLFGGGWLALRACALDALGFDYCPAEDSGDEARREAAIGNQLLEQVHMAQLAVATAPVCLPPQPTAPPPITKPVEPRRAETDPLDRQVIEKGGHNGVLQFTLTWQTRDDLDLNVDCPGGRIDSRPGRAGPGICGDGRKDIDANRNLTENVSANPVENIVWQSDIPDGRYVVEIIEYRAATAYGNTVPFTLRVRANGQERLCHDSVTSLPLQPQQFSPEGRVLGGTSRHLTVELGEGALDCTFVVEPTYRTPPIK